MTDDNCHDLHDGTAVIGMIWLPMTIADDHCYCLFALRFYGPVNQMGSCRARSVYLTTRLLGRLSPLSGSSVLCTFFRQKLTTALLETIVMTGIIQLPMTMADCDK